MGKCNTHVVFRMLPFRNLSETVPVLSITSSEAIGNPGYSYREKCPVAVLPSWSFFIMAAKGL